MNDMHVFDKQLEYQANIHGKALKINKDVPSSFQKYVENNVDDRDCTKFYLIKATVSYLKIAIGEYVTQNCQGCRIDHPSQIQHDICLFTSTSEWVEVYEFHKPALENLNLYDVMNHWFSILAKKNIMILDRIDSLTPEDTIAVYENWEYFKANQKRLSNEWIEFWSKQLLMSYKK